MPDTTHKTRALWQAYWQTHYFNDRLRLIPGHKLPASAPENSVILWLTAENPHSILQRPHHNQLANRRLADCIAQIMDSMPRNTKPQPRYETAIASHPDNQWPPEQGFFVFLPVSLWSKTRKQWESLARDFGQNAILLAEPGKSVRIAPVDPSFHKQLMIAGITPDTTPAAIDPA